MGVPIKRGSAKKFLIKLRNPKGDPTDLSNADNVVVRLPLRDGTKLAIDFSTIPAVPATKLFQGVNFTAVTAGKNGNAISLTFDGVQTITQVITAWNIANPSNQVGSDAATPSSTVLTAGTAKLAGGSDAYEKVQVSGNPILGVLLITLSTADSAQLRFANEQSIEVLMSVIGDDPVVEPEGIIIPNAIDVFD